MVTVLAFDLGASSGRAVAGSFDGERLTIAEVHRFPNDPARIHRHIYWDILRLFHELKHGLLKARHRYGDRLAGLGIDTWAVDFGLLDANGELLGNPYNYRDPQTNGMMEQVWQRIPRSEIFRHTGIQFMPLNTLYQLYAMKQAGSPILQHATTFLMIPDLLRYFLTGDKSSEFTNATTTQFYNPFSASWDREILSALGLPTGIFTEIVQPGTPRGTLLPAIRDELGIQALPVTAVGEHDTASAVAAVPAEQTDFAYISSGTWSLMGTEVPTPVVTEQSLAWNFTNEGGVGNTFRFLKNIMGLWLVQECRRIWEIEGKQLSYAEMVSMAEQAEPFRSLVDPDHSMFLSPAHMPRQIQEYCTMTNQPVPQSEGAISRCIEESLAIKYRMTLERIEALTGKRFAGLHMVGGGIQNEALCRYTANAIGRPVWAGPVEASATGNILLQLISAGHLRDIHQARQVVRQSFPITTYEPRDTATWDEAYRRFTALPFEE